MDSKLRTKDGPAMQWKIERLENLEKAATPGPWRAEASRFGVCGICGPDPSKSIQPIATIEKNDAQLMVALRNAAPHLIKIAQYASSLFSEDGAFEAVSHFNVALVLRDELAKLKD